MAERRRSDCARRLARARKQRVRERFDDERRDLSGEEERDDQRAELLPFASTEYAGPEAQSAASKAS